METLGRLTCDQGHSDNVLGNFCPECGGKIEKQIAKRPTKKFTTLLKHVPDDNIDLDWGDRYEQQILNHKNIFTIGCSLFLGVNLIDDGESSRTMLFRREISQDDMFEAFYYARWIMDKLGFDREIKMHVIVEE